MKVLMVSDFYPPFIGGSFRHVQVLSRSLVARGHEVIVFTIGNRSLKPFENDRGVKVFRFEGAIQKIPFLFTDKTMKYPPPIPDLLISRKLRSVIANEKPNIVHSHGWLLYSILQLKKDFSFPLVVTLHDYGYMCPKISFFKDNRICDEPFTKKCVTCAKDDLGLAKSTFAYLGIKSGKDRLKYVDKFISVSSFVKNANSKYLSINGKVVIVPNFYDIENANTVLNTSTMLPDDFILFVGSLSPHKGIHVLADAYGRLITKTKLVMIGPADEHFSFERNKNIHVIKNAPRDIVTEAYLKSKFVVLPSVWPDPCPTVAFEAMSRKKAVVASDTGGLSEIVLHGKTGLLVSPNNSKKLAESIQYLLENPVTANKMGENGFFRFIENYTSRSVVPKIEKLYSSLC